MTSFLDGPAGGVTLMLRRAPLLLRVVFSRETGQWDALDQLGDTPGAGEEVHVYYREGEPTVGFIDYAGKGGRREGGRFVMAHFRHWPTPPADEYLRDTDLWRQWARQQAGRAAELRRGESPRDGETSDT